MKFRAKIRSFKDITPTVRHFNLEVPLEIDFKAGQFLITDIPTETGKVKRSYSIASDPTKKGIIELCVKKIENGVGTRFYFNLKEGDTIDYTGPVGPFKIKDYQKNIAFISTGTGIAPFRAMIPDVLRQSDKKVVLLTGYRYDEELLYDKEMKELQEKYPNFSYYTCISRPKEGKGKYVQELLEHLPEDAAVYLCGLRAMIDDITKKLEEKGIKNIYFERYD
ncbi:FAD-dependent oxidoreductase [Candidatus Woesearchaeota archaeon]|nr:FAD-dependent oxidoreductase [Candidatus Woesearchaeota archaeon]